MKMGAGIRTTVAQLDDHSCTDRKGFTAVASSDDDDVEPGEGSDPAFGPVANPRLGHTYVIDSDSDDSLFSETALETGLPTGSARLTSKTQDTSSDDDVDSGTSVQERSGSGFCTIENPMYYISLESLGKQMANSFEQQGDIPVDDGCVDDGNDSNAVDERSRLMAAAQAASIPSNDSFSDDSDDVDERSRLMAAAQAASIPSNDSFSDDSDDVDERSRLMAAAQAASIPSNDSFSDDSVVDERSRLMAAAQAATIPSNDSFSDDSVVDERSRLMAAAQAATIPSNDSFSDNSEDGSPNARSISKIRKITREISGRVMPTITKAHHGGEDLESVEGSSFSKSLESDIEAYSTDAETWKVNSNVQKKTTIGSKTGGYGFRKNWGNSAVEAGEEDADDDSDGSGRSDYPEGNDGSKLQKWDVNSASFPAASASFKWSTVKTKIFYSFRALKASASSSSDGSRTVSVKNLAKGVTDERLHDFFQDSGTILDIWIVRDTHSGLSSAYVEFESGSAARKAVQKSGKKLEGRVIMCDTAYENARGNRSAPGSGHGARAARSEMSESDSSSVERRLAENYAALKLFHPELYRGDAKFLSRFNEQVNFGPNGFAQPSTGHLPRPTGGGPEGSKGKAILPWPDSYEDSILKSGVSQAELEESVYYDAVTLESQRSFSTSGRTTRESWVTRRKAKLTRFLFSWKWTRWQRWQLAKQSAMWARRRPCRRVDTEEKKISTSVKKYRH